MAAYINIRALVDANTERDLIASSYGFDDLEAGMVEAAAARLGVNIWNVADKVYGWCCLSNWCRSDWSVDNIVKHYRFAEGVC